MLALPLNLFTFVFPLLTPGCSTEAAYERKCVFWMTVEGFSPIMAEKVESQGGHSHYIQEAAEKQLEEGPTYKIPGTYFLP